MSYTNSLYKFEIINEENYLQYKKNINSDNNSYQLEHHIGRLLSIKKSLELCKILDGDFIEFGSWQGQSLYNTLNIMNKMNIEKKIVGIDCFEGIPVGYGHENQKELMFNDTSLKFCIDNIKKFRNHHNRDIDKDVFVLKSFFNEKEKILGFLNENNFKKFSFVHLDCDVIKSCEEALNLLLDNDLVNDIFILHFDDWGIKTDIPEWYENYKKKKTELRSEELYETNLTKTFKVYKL